MVAKVNISGGLTNKSAETYQKEGHPRGLFVYNHEAESYTPTIKFFANDEFGINQNITATAPTTTTKVHNGGDTVAFTAEAFVGNSWDYASTAQAHTGTYSIDATGTRNGDITRFLWPVGGSDLTVSSYDSLDGYVYITSWPASGSKNFTLQLFLDGIAIGVAINLSSYINTGLQDEWQLFTIPMGDFLTNGELYFDEIRLTTVDAGQGSAPAIYLDDIELVAAGESRATAFAIQPPSGETWVVRQIKWTAVSNNTNIKYNEFFGITSLTNGYSLQVKNDGIVVAAYFADNFYDMLKFPNVEARVSGSTNGLFELVFSFYGDEMQLKGSRNQSIELIVRDDLSSLTEFQASAMISVRDSYTSI